MLKRLSSLYKELDEFTIYKDPTKEELNGLNKIRGLIEYDGTIYAWDGNYTHAQVYKYVNINCFRFAFEGNKWIFDANFDFNLNEIKSFIKTLKDTLSNFGDLNISIQLYNYNDVDEEWNTMRYSFSGINDLINDIEINKENKKTYEEENYMEF